MTISHDYMSQSPGGPCVHCGQGPHTSTINPHVGQTRPVDLIFPEKKRLKDAGLCPTCSEPVGEFKDELSRREYDISGMCQKCQDSVFDAPEED